MCGIVGIIGNSDVAPLLVDGLKRLEYRGYDSAGIATLENGGIARCRAEGKLANLQTRLNDQPVSGKTGIGHTRWATHGVPNEINAHPHATDRVAIVHNVKEFVRAARHEDSPENADRLVRHAVKPQRRQMPEIVRHSRY